MKSLAILERRYYQHESSFNSVFNFNQLFKKYLLKRRAGLADTAIVALGLSIDIINNAENHLAIQALEMTNPNFDASKLDNYSEEELQGIINSSKGKYFELLVVDKLNNGESIGDVSLPEGYKAEIATSLNQPGWDIQISDDSGATADYLQLKATDNLAYIRQSLERYPDMRILATEEIEEIDEMVIQSNVFNSGLSADIEGTVDGQADTLLDDFLEGFNPFLPLALIAASQGYKLVTKKSTYKNALEAGRSRAEKALLISGVGALAYSLGLSWFSLPITLGAGVLINELTAYKELRKYFETAHKELTTLQNHREIKLIGNGVF